MLVIRKIDAMHKRYGKIEDKRCGDCCNLHVWLWSKKYFKCSAYGMSRSTATDWANKWIACGQFNIPYEPDDHRPLFYREPESTTMEGQMEIEMDGNKCSG